jgi:2-polyprenyl-3-methyl-5-hydroxy-6-metoxy-1,4-benzoquinol methylase
MTFLHEQQRRGAWIPPWLRHQNATRYEWAATFAPRASVIEIGCGSGYGTRRLLDAGAAQVVGFDLDPASIDAARRAHPDPRLRFDVASATALPVESGAYDLAVSLEAIEHVEDDDAFVREARRVLRPSGIFLCSTPNRELTNPGTTLRDSPFNPHHVREYERDELCELLGRYFSKIELFCQSFYGAAYGRALTMVGRVSPRAAVRLHQARKVAGIPFEGPARHRPAPRGNGRVPEVLLAVCHAAP